MLAIVIGVAFASGTQILTDTLAGANAAAIRTEYNSFDVRVTAKTFAGGGRAAITAPLLGRIRAVPGEGHADARVRADGVQVVGANRKIVTIAGAARGGSNWVGTTALVGLREGHGPAADTEIAVNAGLATAASHPTAPLSRSPPGTAHPAA